MLQGVSHYPSSSLVLQSLWSSCSFMQSQVTFFFLIQRFVFLMCLFPSPPTKLRIMYITTTDLTRLLVTIWEWQSCYLPSYNLQVDQIWSMPIHIHNKWSPHMFCSDFPDGKNPWRETSNWRYHVLVKPVVRGLSPTSGQPENPK